MAVDAHGSTGTFEMVDGSRRHVVAGIIAVVIGGLSAVGSFTEGDLLSIAYTASLFASALVTLLVAQRHTTAQRGWNWVGGGLLLWAVAGFVSILRYEVEITAIPDLSLPVLYVVGYLPMLIGLAELPDPRVHARRLSTVADGVILFLTLYAVMWLLVVEKYAYFASDELTRTDRAFQSIYPAGDLAMTMLAVRLAVGRSLPRFVGALLIVTGVGCFVADGAILVAYLHNPDGDSSPWVNFVYLVSLAIVAIAAVVSLDAERPRVVAGTRTTSVLTVAVAMSAAVPAIVMLVMVLTGQDDISLGPVAVWLLLLAVALVLRNYAGMRELERAHRQSLWLASHDVQTDMLRRLPFLHGVSEGGMRDRTGTVIVFEVGGLAVIGDRLGLDAADHVVATVAQRAETVGGDGVVAARMAADQFALFLRSATLGRGRQVAGALQTALAQPVTVGDHQVQVEFSIGVAQADGAVIDVLAGVRRATDAMRHARRVGSGYVSVDADLTGTVLASTAQASAPTRSLHS